MGFLGLAAIKFSLIAGAIYLPVNVGSQSAVALLDSGASISVIDATLAARLNLRQQASATVHSDIGKQGMPLAGPVDIIIGSHSIHLSKILVANLSFLSSTGQKTDLVIGQDVLKQAPLAVDFDQHEMGFVDPTKLDMAVSGFTRVPIEADKVGRLTANVRVGTGPAVTAIIDLGSSIPVMMDEGYRLSLHLDRAIVTSTGLVSTASGVAKTIAFSLPSLTIGGLVLNDLPTDAVAGWTAPQHLNLGLPVFQQFKLVLDFSNHAIWIQANDQQAFSREMSGLLVAHEGTDLRIVHIAARSPADDGRFKIGDKITSINGEPITDDYFKSSMWLWRFGPEGKLVSLGVGSQKITLKLHRYY